MSRKNSEYYEGRIANSTWRQYNDIEKQSRAILSMYRKAATKISAEIFEIEKTLCRDGFLDEKLLDRYGRLKKIKASFGDTLGDLEKSTRKQFLKSLTQGMKKTYENIVGELNIDLNLPNLRVFEEMAKEPWRGEDFSSRLWKNKEQLFKNLEDVLVSGIAQGMSITNMALKLDDLINGGFHNVHRLVRTETMHYLNAASVQAYKDSGVDYIQFWAAADERVCARCGEKKKGGLHESIYPIDRAPTLPLHANCRCCYLPVTDKKMIEDYLAKQAKKPSFMLPNVFIENELEEQLEKNVMHQIINCDDWIKQLKEPYRDQLYRIWDNTVIKIRDDIREAMLFDGNNHLIVLNPTHNNYKKYLFNQAITHELAHQIDMNGVESWNQAIFTNAIEETKAKFMSKAFEIQNALNANKTLKNDVMLGDILDIVSSGRFRLQTGHPPEYFEADARRLPAEIFADFYALCSENKAVDFLEKYLYDILKAFNEITKGA